MVIRYHNLHQGTGISYSLSYFSCFPLISHKKKNIPSKAHAKSFANWYCQLSSYALKDIVWGLWDSQNSVDSVLPAGPAFSWVESVRVSSALPQNYQCAKTSAFTLLSKSNKTFYSCLLCFELSCAKWKTRVIGNYAAGCDIYHRKALGSFWMDVSSWKTTVWNIFVTLSYLCLVTITCWENDGDIVSGQSDEPNFSGPFLGYYKGTQSNH